MSCKEVKCLQTVVEESCVADVAIMANNAGRHPAVATDAQNEFTQAAANGDMDRLRALMSTHPNLDMNGTNRYGRTAIQVMTMTRPEVAEFLLGYGADPNEPDRDVGRTPLHDAAEHGHEDTVQWLLRYGADPRSQEWRRGNTPAHLAAGEGRSVRILELLSRGSTLWEKNAAGRTPHGEATANGRRETAQWIASYHRSGEGTKLTHLCRLTIHRVIGTQRMRRIGELGNYPLPEAFMDYLNMCR